MHMHHRNNPGLGFFRRALLEFLDSVFQRTGKAARIGTDQEVEFVRCEQREFRHYAFR